MAIDQMQIRKIQNYILNEDNLSEILAKMCLILDSQVTLCLQLVGQQQIS
jgi:hypothetical protein